MTLSFVVFHADRRRVATADESRAIKGATLTTYGNLDRYRQMIRMLNESIRHSNPGAKCVILTDEYTDGLDGLGFDQILRYEIDAQSLMLARLEAQINFLKRHASTDGIILVDSDTLVVDSIATVLDGSFAVGVTHRGGEREMPYNGGVFFIRKARLIEATCFFERMLDIYREKYRKYATWWGDQMALRDVVLEFQRSSKDDLVRVFPCATHNYSPVYGSVYRDVLCAPGRASIWHFKGRRKLAMRIYAGSYFGRTRIERAGFHLFLRALYLLERVRRK